MIMTNNKPVTAGYRNYQGGYFKVLIDHQQTNGGMALLEMVLPKGAEPPPHIHVNEDESFYLQEGAIQFTIGEKTTVANPGDAVFAPRGIAHHFKIQSEYARFLNLITPGQLMDYFIEFSEPATGALTITPPQGPPPADLIQKMISRITGEYGVIFI